MNDSIKELEANIAKLYPKPKPKKAKIMVLITHSMSGQTIRLDEIVSGNSKENLIEKFKEAIGKIKI